MSIEFLKFDNSPPTRGGEFEKEALACFRDKLFGDALLIGNVQLSKKSNFLEYDGILTDGMFCDILEFKCIFPNVTVERDCLWGVPPFKQGGIFSKLSNKFKVLSSAIANPNRPNARIDYYVIVPDYVKKLIFKYKPHEESFKVMRLSQAIKYFQKKLDRSNSSPGKFKISKSYWQQYYSQIKPHIRTDITLGQFHIKKPLKKIQQTFVYKAADQHPCPIDVQLKEYPYDHLLNEKELSKILKQLSHEMAALRKIRHPYIQCAIGHFQTGCSLVQVSDWFDGMSLELSWSVLEQAGLFVKIGIMSKICEALSFCHEKAVFHRNVNANNVFLSDDLEDIRLSGFEYSRDLDNSVTISTSELNTRGEAIIPPEELESGKSGKPRYADIFQTGVLFYRIIENGKWPFKNSYDYVTGGELRPFQNYSHDKNIKDLRKMVIRMLAIEPQSRPGSLYEVLKLLKNTG